MRFHVPGERCLVLEIKNPIGVGEVLRLRFNLALCRSDRRFHSLYPTCDRLTDPYRANHTGTRHYGIDDGR